jgi:hypothetical protein
MSAKPQLTTRPTPRRITPKRAKAPKPDPIADMRREMFLLSYRMKATVQDALVSQKSKLWDITTGHLEEMIRILDNNMNQYR